MQNKISSLLLTFPALFFLLIFFIYPITSLIPLSLNFPNVSLIEYQKIFAESLYINVILNTLRISFLVTLCCLFLGYPVAFFISNVAPKNSGFFLIPVILPFWTSLLVRTYAWMIILQRRGIVNLLLLKLGIVSSPLPMMYNEFSVILGMVHVLLPFMILPIYGYLQSRDRNLEHAAASSGASPIKTFFLVTLPLSKYSISAGCLLVFVIAIGFFITPALLGGKKVIMISMLIEEYVIEFLDWGFASAISFILLIMTLSIIAIYYKIIGLNKVAS